MIRKTVNISKDLYYVKHLEIINPLLPIRLTEKEISILACFLELKEDVFSPYNKFMIKEKLKLSDSSLSNYLKSIKNKKFILCNTDGIWYINPVLLPDSEYQEYNFKIVKI